MNKIDLRYINSNPLTELLSIEDLVEHIQDKIINDLDLAKCYINKYNNQYDRLEGTDVTPLMEQVKTIEANLKRFKNGDQYGSN